ncbi:MAG: hypothetical protein PHS53_00260 [Candidatus Pacebacteria bacterium]|nr:hypothetical protein [Candidatus Paceibacterota bacterium]
MYYFIVSKGLLDAKHRRRMGVAVWEFLWCLDRVTKINADGLGLVLGGKPVNLCDFTGSLGTSEVTVSRNLQKLARWNYLTLVHAPYGIVIQVPKAKKRFVKNANPHGIHRFSGNDRPGFIKSAQPPFRNDKPDFRSDKPNKRSKDENEDEKGLIAMNALIEERKLEISRLVKSL